ncbi:MAG: hypothetical protein WA702_22565 [Bradyrhizobium sp.]|uniref:hypothetical protein n=1 Tax=Bradyrhizobium sp. TaxID=376 RepID=UPI003C7BD1D1
MTIFISKSAWLPAKVIEFGSGASQAAQESSCRERELAVAHQCVPPATQSYEGDSFIRSATVENALQSSKRARYQTGILPASHQIATTERDQGGRFGAHPATGN